MTYYLISQHLMVCLMRSLIELGIKVLASQHGIKKDFNCVKIQFVEYTKLSVCEGEGKQYKLEK